MGAGHLTPEQQQVYVTQLKDMGIWNAREYVQDRDMENMYKEIQNAADYDWDVIQGKWAEIQKNWEDGSNETVQAIKAAGISEKTAWEDLTSDQKNIIAEATDEWKKVSKRDAQKIIDEYGYELPEFGLKSSKDAPKENQDGFAGLDDGGAEAKKQKILESYKAVEKFPPLANERAKIETDTNTASKNIQKLEEERAKKLAESQKATTEAKKLAEEKNKIESEANTASKNIQKLEEERAKKIAEGQKASEEAKKLEEEKIKIGDMTNIISEKIKKTEEERLSK
jgi:hypothetical protein